MDDAKKSKRNKDDTKSGWRTNTNSGGGTAKYRGAHGGEEKERGCSLCLAAGRYRQVKTHTLVNCHYQAKKAESNAIRQDESDEEFHHSKVSNIMKNVPLRTCLSTNTNIKSTYGSDTPRFTTMVAVVLNKYLNKVRNKIRLNVLVETGCSNTLINRRVIPLETYTNTKRHRPIRWSTNGGTFETQYELTVAFSLSEFNPHKQVEVTMSVNETTNRYDMILGRDCLEAMGLDILFSRNEIRWDDYSVPLRPSRLTAEEQENHNDYLKEITHLTEEPEFVQLAQSRATTILDSDYKKTEIPELLRDIKHLDRRQKQNLRALLTKFEDLFDGTLGDFQVEADFELQEGARPSAQHPYPVAQAHYKPLRKEIERF